MQALGNVYVFSSPSGGGKSSLIQALLSSVKDVKRAISFTTRPISKGEVDGIDYNFIDHIAFEQLINKNELLEFTQVFGNYYGTSKHLVEEQVSKGVDLLLALDWQGARAMKNNYDNAKLIYLLPPSKGSLRERLIKRGRDELNNIDARMRQFFEQLHHFLEFDYIVVNDDFERALSDLQHIVYANRLTSLRQNNKYSHLVKSLLADGN